MKHENIEGAGLTYAPCRYGMSRILFRGPKRRLDTPYVAFVGGWKPLASSLIDRFQL
jgi:hypothetical protein